MAARCKGTAGQRTWQVSDLIPFPQGVTLQAYDRVLEKKAAIRSDRTKKTV